MFMYYILDTALQVFSTPDQPKWFDNKESHNSIISVFTVLMDFWHNPDFFFFFPIEIHPFAR